MPQSDNGASVKLEKALDALEDMCFQYLTWDGSPDFHHSFMSAGENACEVLPELRPDRWEETNDGMRFIGDPNAR